MRVRIGVLVALLALALLVACVPAGASGGAGARSAAGAPGPAPQPAFSIQPRGTVTAPDPEGGPPLTLRVRRAPDGKLCPVLRRPRGPGRQLACLEELPVATPYLTMVNALFGRTLVHGTAGPAIVRVELVGLHARAVRLSRHGLFLTVLPGGVPIHELRVRYTFRGGHTATVDLDSPRGLRTRDPVSGEHWRLGISGSTSPGPDDTPCASVVTHDGSEAVPLGADGDLACGDLRATPFAVRIGRFAGRRGLPDAPGGVAWTRRTVVVGVAGPRVAAVDVRAGAAPPQRLELTAEGRGFLAIFPPDVPPEALRVTVTLVDGTTRTVDRSFGLTNPVTGPGAVARHSAGRGSSKPPQPPFTQPLGGTITAPDPEGGRPWILRVRRTTSGPICSTVRRPGTRPVPLSCVEDLRADRPFDVVVSGLPDRTAVHGIVGPGVVAVELVGVHARPVRLARRARAFFVVLAGRVPAESVAVRFTFRDGRTETAGWDSASEARPADPVSGERWWLTAHTRHRGKEVLTCTTFHPHDGTDDAARGRMRNTLCGSLATEPFAIDIRPFAGRSTTPPREVRTLRTLVFGVVGPRVAAVDVAVGAGPPRRVELTQEGRAFIVILPPDVLPSTVRVVVTFLYGTTRTVDRATGLTTVPRH